MRIRESAVLALACLGAGQGVSAQQENPEGIEEVVVSGRMSRYSATKSDVPIMETARSLSVETRQDIWDKGALELADAYLYSAGVFGERYGFATRGDWVAVRGQDVPEYRDSLQALFGNYNNTRPDIYTIQQVEVLKGPASVLYGQGSLGGIVNVVSKTPQEESFHEVVAEMGNYDRRQIAADSTGRIDEDGEWLYRVNAVYRDRETQVDHVGEKARVFAPSVTWRPSEATNLTLLLNLQDSDSDTGEQFLPVDGTRRPGPGGRYVDVEAYYGEPGFNRYDTESQSLTLLGDHALNADWSVEATARYTSGESSYNQAWPSFIGGDRYVYNPDGSLYKDGEVPRTFYVADNSSEQTAIDARLRGQFATGVVEHELLAGMMYQDVATDTDSANVFALGYDLATGRPDDIVGDRYWINIFDPEFTGAPDAAIRQAYVDTPESTTTDLGFYLNDQVEIGRWSLVGGLRYDEVETDTGTTVQEDDAVSYSVGGMYRFDNGLSPYISYAESFQPVVGTDNYTGEPLKPQEGEQVEAGVKYQHGSGAYVTVSWFDIEVSNLDNPNAQVGAASQQEGVSSMDGMELESHLPLGNDFRWELNASLVDTENASGYRFASLPKRQASSWLSYRPTGAWRGFKAGLGLRYVGESWDGADNLRTPSYTLADMMVGYVTDEWDATLNVRNAADERYEATCLARGDCFLGEQRTIVARVARHF